MKISSYQPVSSQKYENGYRTKICNFTVVRGRPVQNDLIDFFRPAIVNSQIAQVDRPTILERMVFGSSPLLSGVFVTFFLFQIEDLEKF